MEKSIVILYENSGYIPAPYKNKPLIFLNISFSFYRKTLFLFHYRDERVFLLLMLSYLHKKFQWN